MSSAVVTPALFTCEIERETSAGTTVRLLVEPIAPERVRVLTYERARAGAWQRVAEEEGRVLEWAQLRAGVSFAAAFPAGATADAAEPEPARRKRRRR